MGFPVTSLYAHAALHPLLAITYEGGHDLVGNAMHVGSAGLVLVATLLSVRIDASDQHHWWEKNSK